MLADHSDRSGSATWILKEIIEQDLSDVLIATVADAKAIDALKAKGVKAGDSFDMEVGGLVDELAGAPVRIQGTVLNAVEGRGQLWVVVTFGRGNVLVLSRYLVQVMEPGSLSALGLRRVGVQGVRHQVARALPPRLRRQRLCQDDPAGRTG